MVVVTVPTVLVLVYNIHELELMQRMYEGRHLPSEVGPEGGLGIAYPNSTIPLALSAWSLERAIFFRRRVSTSGRSGDHMAGVNGRSLGHPLKKLWTPMGRCASPKTKDPSQSARPAWCALASDTPLGRLRFFVPRTT